VEWVGAAERLRATGREVVVERIELPSDAPVPEVRAAFTLAARLAERVADARAAGSLPVVLAGNCATATGSLAGLGDAHPAIVWLDAHADFNTPETTHSGMLDGMALAIATGRCWTAAASAIPGFVTVSEERACLVGTRDMDAAEEALLGGSAVTVVAPSALEGQLFPALDTLRTRAETVYLHLDLDVLDPTEGTVNEFAAPDGLSLDRMREVIDAVRRRFRLGAVALTAYDPSYDADRRIEAAALAILDTLVAK